MRVRFDKTVKDKEGRVLYRAGFDYERIDEKAAKAFVEQGVAHELKEPTPPQAAADNVAHGRRATRKAEATPPADAPKDETKDKDAA